MLNYLEAVGIQVSDQQRALDFYVNQSGFIKINDEDMGEGARWIVVAAPGSQTGLILSKATAAEQGNGFEGLTKGLSSRPVGGFTGYIFYTDNMEETYETLKARGIHFSVPPCSETWGKWAQFSDPDGNESGIHCFVKPS